MPGGKKIVGQGNGEKRKQEGKGKGCERMLKEIIGDGNRKLKIHQGHMRERKHEAN